MPEQNKEFQNSVALVTGGGSGIGRATAFKFASYGALVVVAERSEVAGLETVEMIQGQGGKASFIAVDVSQEDQVKQMIASIVAEHGALDYAVNNAGVSGDISANSGECSLDNWQQVIGVNLTGVWLCLKYELEYMWAAKKGSVVNMASILGLVGSASPAYTASKHGVVGLTKSYALSSAPHHVRVNAVCPGYIETPMVQPVLQSHPSVQAEIVSKHPIGRLGEPKEIAEAVAWLCSDAASFVTGHAMAVDGGYLAQ